MEPTQASQSYKNLTITPLDPSSHAIRLTITSPPTNLLTPSLLLDLHTYLTTLTTPPAPKVIIISSSSPTFWLNHLDLRIVSATHPLLTTSPLSSASALNLLSATIRLLNDLPTIFIAEINGRVIGGGNELAANTDMRFAGPSALFGIPEVAGGIVHGGALQRMVRLLGPGRAMEWMVGVRGCGAREAERVGWVNRAFESEGELREYVEGLARRIAAWPRGGIEGTKKGVQEALRGEGSLGRDMRRLGELAHTEEAQRAITRILELGEFGADNEFELGLPDTLDRVWEGDAKI